MITLPCELHQLADKPVWGVFLLTGKAKPKYNIPKLTGRRKRCSCNDPATLDTYHALAPFVDNKTAVLALSMQLASQYLPRFNIGALDIDLYKADSEDDDCHKLVNWANSFTEWSPSGNGFHVLFYYEKNTQLPADKLKALGADCVSASSFLTMTGNVVKDVPFRVLSGTQSPAKDNFPSQPMSPFLPGTDRLSPIWVYNQYVNTEDALIELLIDSGQYEQPPRGKKLLYVDSTSGIPGTIIKPSKKGDWFVVDDWHGGSPLNGWTRDPFDCLASLYFGGNRGKATRWVADNVPVPVDAETGEVRV